MAVSIRQQKNAFSTNSTITSTLASTPVVNNFIVAVAGSNASMATQRVVCVDGTEFEDWEQSQEITAGGTTNGIGIYIRKVTATTQSTYKLYSNTSTWLYLYEITPEFLKDISAAVGFDFYATNTSNIAVTSAATPTVYGQPGSSGVVIAGIWWSGGAVTATSVTNGFTKVDAAPGGSIRGSTANLTVGSLASSGYNTTFNWTTARAAAFAIIAISGGEVLQINTSEYISVSETDFYSTPLYLDGYIITESETVSVVDVPGRYDDLVIVGDRVTISVEAVSGADQFFAWFG